MPLVGFRRGPAFKDLGVLEMPVTGTASAPLEILDSWGFFAAPDRYREPAEYGTEGKAVLDLMQGAGAGIISVYADPSQIHGQDVFFDTVALWADGAPPVQYAELAQRLAA